MIQIRRTVHDMLYFPRSTACRETHFSVIFPSFSLYSNLLYSPNRSFSRNYNYTFVQISLFGLVDTKGVDVFVPILAVSIRGI